MGFLKTLVSFLFILFVFVFYSYSQRVIPSNDVQNHVNVRASNSAGSEIINTLHPGESAEYIESVPYWHKVRCDNGDEGYVSKRWTLIDDGTSESEGKDDLVIGSWNIKHFASKSKVTIDYAAFADIFEKFDVLAIQELSTTATKEHLDAFKAELNDRGYKYEFVISEKTGYTSANSDPNKGRYYERYGFLWDMDRVELLDSDEPYAFIHQPILDNPVFRQVPIVAEFRAKSEHGFDFKVVSVHAAFNEGIPYVRQAEFNYLNDWMIDQKNDSNIKEKDIFIMGDFNSNPPDQKDAHYFDTIIGNTTEYRVIFNEPVLAGEKSIKTTLFFPTPAKPGDSTKPVYDHLLLSEHASYAIPDTLTWASGIIGVIQFDQEPRWQNLGYKDTWKAISDHRPIWIKLDYDTEDRE